jgi:hypothetical protein
MTDQCLVPIWAPYEGPRIDNDMREQRDRLIEACAKLATDPDRLAEKDRRIAELEAQVTLMRRVIDDLSVRPPVAVVPTVRETADAALVRAIRPAT